MIGADGDLLGIGSLRLQMMRSGNTVEINMVVPIDLLHPILDDLLTKGHAERQPRPWLGVFSAESDGDVVVMSVSENGPAARAGIQRGAQLADDAAGPVAHEAPQERGERDVEPLGEDRAPDHGGEGGAKQEQDELLPAGEHRVAMAFAVAQEVGFVGCLELGHQRGRRVLANALGVAHHIGHADQPAQRQDDARGLGDRNEAIRRDQAESRALPARQRLDCAQFAVRHMQLRLIPGAKLG